MAGVLTPRFLTEKVAAAAVDAVLGATLLSLPLRERFKRHACHIVILVPSMKDEWPSCDISPVVLYQRSHNKEAWPHKFDDIAQCKALQLWQGRNDDRTDIMPHLLFAGDTPFWGGVKRHGIVVACSGVQPWFDKMIAGMVADLCIGLAYDEWMIGFDKHDDRDFLS